VGVDSDAAGVPDRGGDTGGSTLQRVDGDPDAGEWTVRDDGALTVRF
jgi:hypothetical protein